ncbi:MFS transporter [Acidovorax sp. CCYZU-2555]|uniref:MFS transporter n=1 Tax=Acidovorax sp. CCYZU-2555 TaxID=2835042 RepID=UPI001BD1AD73|nr:MFS transporter [Acidovorax sp. CCYZU-2555]MBS7780922.1 MFS transporter [Acidovorax sp. CCYZU-2555]
MSVQSSTVEFVGTARDELQGAYAKVTWRLVPFFCLCYLAAYLDRINVGLAKLQMLNDLGFSEAVYGLGAGLFFIGYILFEVPSNLVLAKMGARLWIARIMITWGLISGATYLVTTPMQFYVLRFLLGVAEAGFFPGVMLYLTYWYPTHKRSRIMAMFLMGLPMASLVGGPLSGWIMTAFAGTMGYAGWQWLFVLEAIPSVLLGILCLTYLPNGIEAAKWLSPREKHLLRDSLDNDQLAESHHSLWAALSSGRVWLLGLIDLSLMMSVYAISFWLPTIMRDAGVRDTFHIGLLTAIPNALAIIALIMNGASSDRLRERRWHIVVPAFIGAMGMGLSTLFTDNIALTVTMFALATAGITATFPVFWCLPATFLTGPAAAAGIALIASIASFGGFAATYILGWLRDVTHGSSAGILLFAGCLLVGCALTLALPKHVVNR